METEIQHRTEQFVHDISNPVASGLCAEMLEVAEEASRAGDFGLAAEIYGSQLADLAQPDRGLCLRRADALAQCGRIAEALDCYCTAASLGRLRAEELGLLVESIAQSLREKNESIKSAESKPGSKVTGEGGSCSGSRVDVQEGNSSDLFTCRLCNSLLYEPATLQCGHTFCKRCLDNDGVNECKVCKYKLNKKNGIVPPMGLRVNVVLSSLLEKWFNSESKARRYWLEGERMLKQKDYTGALERYNSAVELAPLDCMLIGQRAELLVEMERFPAALREADELCRMEPLSAQAHHTRAVALSKLGRREEALQEYFLCVALRPGWGAAHLEAQKILGEVFSSVFERDGLPILPPQSSGVAPCFKPSALLGPLQLPGSSRDPARSLAKTLPSLKRKSTADAPRHCPPCKVLKTGAEGSPQAVRRVVLPEVLDSVDMECSLCMRLFFEPVATPCGHTFCLKCLERCLDHNPTCPLCKENLCEYLATRGYHKTLLMEEVLVRYLSEELAERKKIQEEELKELSNLTQEVPIFVCTMAFPTIPCPLHIFEPRYRLMIRRSMETGTKQFGMCIADDMKGFADYGCMLEVRDVKLFPDGRSVVDTIGVSRFKVLSHGQRDGYNTAKIEYLEDTKVEGEELSALLQLHDSVYDQASAWFSGLKENLKTQILSHFGSLPAKDTCPQGNPSGPAWCWWLLAVLPLESRAQLTILSMTSLRERLIAIRRVLIFVTRKRPR
ncbi:hypothetical protein GJAV_G00259990 [Gymnothorax javanicus]|nr:hypothetical protein GJAV_G00259990 [Gymnothorax javanicus]